MVNPNKLTVTKLSRLQRTILELLKRSQGGSQSYSFLSRKLAETYVGPATMKQRLEDEEMLKGMSPKARKDLEEIWGGPLPKANKNLDPMRILAEPVKYEVTRSGLVPEYPKQRLSATFKASLSRSLWRLEERGIVDILPGEYRDPNTDLWLETQIISLVNPEEEGE